MKKLLALILVVGLGALLGIEVAKRLRAHPQIRQGEASAPRVPAPSPPARDPRVYSKIDIRTARPPAPAVAQRPSPSTQGSRGEAFSRQLFEKGLVKFRIEEGWAITMGDVILGKVESQEIQEGFNEPEGFQLWPTSTIPFAIDPGVTNPERITQAIEYLNQFTPVRFVPFEGEDDAVVFVPSEEHCNSYLGWIGGHQPIRLGEQCGPQEVLHEIMHALGFIHEQMRSDRDDFVEVLWDNIDPEKEDQFYMAPDLYMRPLKGSNFDLTSVMMYSPTIFARDPSEPTMQAVGGGAIAPVASGLSREDIRRLEVNYGGR